MARDLSFGMIIGSQISASKMYLHAVILCRLSGTDWSQNFINYQIPRCMELHPRKAVREVEMEEIHALTEVISSEFTA